MSPSETTLVLFREDLRTEDHQALAAAAKRGAVIPVFIWDPASYGAWAPGGASRFWLRRALHRLAEALETLGSPLIVRHGDTMTELSALHQTQGFDHLDISQGFDPITVAWEAKLDQWAKKNQVMLTKHQGTLLTSPENLRNQSGSYYKVFTPFWNQLRSELRLLPKTKIKGLTPPSKPLKSNASIDSVDDAHGAKWQQPLVDFWDAQPLTANATLKAFLKQNLESYADRRDFPAQHATSHLSPFLRFGEISPHRIWHEVNSSGGKGQAFLRQLAWRDFAYHLLWHRPETIDQPLRQEFQNYPWRTMPDGMFQAWTQGKTGIRLVDAGMRELWLTGIMHNRVRMIAASFLVKHLHLSWQLGARWFWDTLVDADLANNTMGWQWVAGCGADAAPFFRIFNPETQAQKFDKGKEYIEKWQLDDAPTTPIVDLKKERQQALDQYHSTVKGSSTQ